MQKTPWNAMKWNGPWVYGPGLYLKESPLESSSCVNTKLSGGYVSSAVQKQQRETSYRLQSLLTHVQSVIHLLQTQSMLVNHSDIWIDYAFIFHNLLTYINSLKWQWGWGFISMSLLLLMTEWTPGCLSSATAISTNINKKFHQMQTVLHFLHSKLLSYIPSLKYSFVIYY